MNITTILAEKRNNSERIKKGFNILLKYKPLGLIKLSDNQLTDELVDGLKTLQAGFVVYSEDSDTKKISNNLVITGSIDYNSLSGFDFIVCDDEIENLKKYLGKGIVPIMLSNNHLSSLLKEFNPIKNDGNSFLFENLNKWDIFYSVVRYLENYKFSFDNKNLVKNILKI